MRKGRFAQRSAGGIRLRSHRSAGDQAGSDAGQHSQRRLPALRQAHRRYAARRRAAGSPFGPGIAALAIYLHTRHMVSYNRLVEMFKGLFGLEISEGAIANIFSRASAPFAAEAERIDAEVRAAAVIASDETSARVEGQTCWQWVFGSATAVAHRIAASRGKAVVREFLEG